MPYNLATMYCHPVCCSVCCCPQSLVTIPQPLPTRMPTPTPVPTTTSSFHIYDVTHFYILSVNQVCCGQRSQLWSEVSDPQLPFTSPQTHGPPSPFRLHCSAKWCNLLPSTFLQPRLLCFPVTNLWPSVTTHTHSPTHNQAHVDVGASPFLP